MPHDIFICYSRTDLAIANPLAERLRAEGWTVFLDVQTRVGERWHKAIQKELHAAKALVALWSAQSCDSDYVLEEAEYGKRKGILFPAFIERIEFPYGFGRIQTADLVGWTGERDHAGLVRIVDALRLQLGGREPQPAPAVTVAPVPAAAAPPPSPGQTFRDPLRSGGEGPLMVVIPAGRFLMGSPVTEPERSDDETPQHEVRIALPFAMGVYAVTFDDYDRHAQATGKGKPDDRGWGRGKRPVIHVSWDDACEYCQWLCEQTGNAYRLPSEAEWEYACRAGTTTPFHTGERISPEQANFNGNSTYNGSARGEYRQKTLPVGSFAANDFGLYDTHGNVWEWCQDTWHENYEGAPTDGSAWEGGGSSSRVLRGGSWLARPRLCRAAYRYVLAPDDRGGFIGFRVCRVAPIEPLRAAPLNPVTLKR